MFAKQSFILNYFCHKLQYNANRKERLLIFSIFIIGLPKLVFFAVKALLQFIQLFFILICCGSQCTHFLVQVFKQLFYGTGNKRSRKEQINKCSDSGLFTVPYFHLRSFGSRVYGERFELRSHFKSSLSLIVRVNVVRNRTVVVDSDWRFDNLCGSHLQSQSELYHVSWCYYTLVIDLIGQVTLKMTIAQVVETSVTVNNNSPIQDYIHPDDQTQTTFQAFTITSCHLADLGFKNAVGAGIRV